MRHGPLPYLMTAAMALALSACGSEPADTAEADAAADTAGDVIVPDERMAPVGPAAGDAMTDPATPTPETMETTAPSTGTGSPTPR